MTPEGPVTPGGGGSPARPGQSAAAPSPAQGGRGRPRDLGLRLGSLDPGSQNAVTDVPGVRVGQVTLIQGWGPLVPGRGPVRTGVTAVLPHGGNPFVQPVTAAAEVINGYGKAVGLIQVRELGRLETPLLLCGTLNVGLVADAVVDHMIQVSPEIGISAGTVNPVVLECSDAYLNDIQGRHVRREHVLQAIRGARPGPVEEGAVGAGTGMVCFGYKGGVGTASRLVPGAGGVLGALVLTNFGRPGELVIAGVPVGRILGPPGEARRSASPHGTSGGGPAGAASDAGPGATGAGSVVVVLATDAGLSSRQLGRLARRAVAGLARVGWAGDHRSGDFVVAFSTARAPLEAAQPAPPRAPLEAPQLETLELEDDGPFGQLVRAAAEATEEAVVNALFAAPDMEGRDGRVAPGLPVEEVVGLLRARGALSGPEGGE